MSPASGLPRVAIVNDYEIVVAGLASLLSEYDDRLQVVEVEPRSSVPDDVDIVLFDTFANAPGRGVSLPELVHPAGPKVVVFTWTSDERSVAQALAQGAVAHLSKTMSTKALVRALEDIHDGVPLSAEHEQQPEADSAAWPGRDLGLSPREAEVIALIARGLSNQEVADSIFLSVNSVKTYIRTAYRKIGVQRRGQAVLWALQHGFASDPEDSRSREY